MANKDLRSFLQLAAEHNEVVRVSKNIDPNFGATAILSKLEMENEFPVVHFDSVGDSAIPVVSNVFASRKRLALALGCEEKSLNAFYRSREDGRIQPVMVDDGPVHEVVLTGDEVDLYSLPIIKHNELDAGPYITNGAAVTRDLETGIRNIGVYRHQLHGKNKLGIHMAETSHVNLIYSKYLAKNIPMPISITIGHHPAFYLGCLSFVPVGVDEYGVAGALMGEPLELVNCVTNDLQVPAAAEIVLEGFIHPNELQTEAPFGEFTTCYGGPHPYQVITVTAITMRKKPIYQDCFSGHLDHQLMGGTGRLSVIYKTARQACPTIQDVFMAPSGCCRLTCYISIKKRHEGEAKNVIGAAMAADPFIKYVVVVDDDVDIYDDSAVLQAIATRLKPDQDAFMIRNAKGHPLDPCAYNGYVVTKVGIDCTKPLKGFPETVRVPGAADVSLGDVLSPFSIE